MLTNNNTPSSAPPPPPPLPPADWGKNWKPAKNNDKNENTLGSTPSKTSNSTQLKRGLSEVSNPNLFEELKNNSKFKEANNANGETADKGSNIRQSEPNRISTTKPVSPRVLSPQQDNGNSNKPSGTNNSTQSEKGLSENPIQLATEQKIDTPILINTLVGISKTAALKYSIATLLLCISSVTAGIYTYLSISVTLSDPVLFTVIAFVSASVMLSLAAYLINSHLSAINSEKGVDPGRKQSQDLQKAKGLEHSNTHTSSPPVALRTSSVPTPPTLKNNTTNKSIPSGGGKQQGSGDLMADLNKTLKSRRKAIDGEDDVQQQNNEVCQNQSQDSSLQKAKELEHSNTPTPSFPVMSGTPSAPPPPPPPLPQNAAPLPPPPTASKYTEKPKNGAPKKANESEHDRSALFAQIRGGGVKLKRVNNEFKNAKTPGNNNDGKSQDFSDELKEEFKSSKSNAEQETGEELAARIEKSIQENKQHTMRNAQCHDYEIANILKRRLAIELSSSESEVSDHSDSDDWSNDKSKKPKEKKLTKSRKKPTPSNSQPEDERGSKSPDSGHESDDNEKSKPTSPLHSVPKAGKPLVPPKTAGLQTKSEASPAAQANNVDSVNSEVQKPFQVQSVVDRGKRK
ncbi:WH2 domain-containing protein [Wolbachia endosymbiont (group B) of Sphaerophoria taeniata]|uniref:WH2 domain-containing protein n=1 Tax=Wolbachia endosymbiont (group B) of Sphaerophoria taeniata TaxID=2954058 RepID=UPI00221E97F9|nr:WH2 domain-containing protein [Wolbachia endosymbiont (group B) of Sphaerophoria taeniata]